MFTTFTKNKLNNPMLEIFISLFYHKQTHHEITPPKSNNQLKMKLLLNLIILRIKKHVIKVNKGT